MLFDIPKKLLSSLTRVKANDKKISVKKYSELVKSIRVINNDIEEFEKKEQTKRIIKKIKSLKRMKDDLVKELIEVEEHFYDVEKGLWIGLAWDLNDVDKDCFLLYLKMNKLHNHIELFGTSGYGKSRLMATIVRQFIHFDWSIFIVDPKGGEKQEVAQWIYDFAIEAEVEHIVSRIMPSYPQISDKGNPIFGMTDIEIASLGVSLMSSGTGPSGADEQFFSGQVEKILKAILTSMTYLEKATFTEAEINKAILEEVEKYSLLRKNKGFGGNVYNDGVVQMPDAAMISELDTTNKKISQVMNGYNRTLVTFRELAFFAMYDNLKELQNSVEITPLPQIDDNAKLYELKRLKQEALMQLKDLTTIEKSRYEAVGMSLNLLMSQLAYGPIGEILCDIRINPLVQRVRSDEGAIVIFQPSPMRFPKVSEIMTKVYTNMWLSLFGTIGVSGRGIKKRVAYVVDEGKPMIFVGIEELYNKVRQLGMTLFVAYQSKFDIKSKVGPDIAEIISDNTATTITMKQASGNSLEEVAKSFGTIQRTETIQMTEMDGHGRTTIVHNEVEKVSPNDIDKLKVGEGFVRHDGNEYFVIFPYQRDPFPVKVEMPELDSEKAFKFLEEAEKHFSNKPIIG